MMSVLMESSSVFRSLINSVHTSSSSSSSTGSFSDVPRKSAPSQNNNNNTSIAPKVSILDVCHRKIRLIGGAPVAFIGGLVAKARRKDKEASAPGEDPKLYLEEAVLERKHGDLDLRTLVELPAGLDYNEWLASHTIAFFDHINLIYGTISEFCTMSGCPDMTGPGLRTYLWFDEKGKKTKVAAPQYIDYVMTFTQKTINDESIFPTKYANEFPSSFESLVKKILRLLFHVVAHMYHSHFKEIMLLKLHSELNSVFTQIILFNERYHLIEEKETEILQDLAAALRVHSEPPELAAPPARPNTSSASPAKDNNNCLDSESGGGGGRDSSGTPTHPHHHRHESQGGPPPSGGAPAIPASG